MEVNSMALSSCSINSEEFDFDFDVDFDFDFVLSEEVECLSNWEFVDALDAKNDSGGSVNNELGSELQSAVLPANSVPASLTDFFFPDHYEKDKFDYGCSDNLEADGVVSFSNDDEDVGDAYDLDDELVPWSVTSKFDRQRMRKLGKRQFPKMCSSRRSPHLLLRPGCVRGKHGLGLKYNY